MKQLILIAFLLSLTHQKVISVSPKHYYVGETVNFFFEMDNPPTPQETQLKYQIPQETQAHSFKNCRIDGKGVSCFNVKIAVTQATQNIKITTSEASPVIITTIAVLDGQQIAKVFPKSYSGSKQQIDIRFLEAIDQSTVIIAKNGNIESEVQNCGFHEETDTHIIRCDFTLSVAGAYKITYNGIATIDEFIIYKPDVIPQNYYKGETVTFTINYGNESNLETDLKLNLIYRKDINGPDFNFAQCTRNVAVITCPNVKIDIEKNDLQIISPHNPKINLFLVSTQINQFLSSIIPTSIFKTTVSDVTLTFNKIYDLLPIIQARKQGNSIRTKATDCEFQANDAKIVKCKFTIEKVGTYEIIFNEKTTSIYFTVEEEGTGGGDGGTGGGGTGGGDGGTGGGDGGTGGEDGGTGEGDGGTGGEDGGTGGGDGGTGGGDGGTGGGDGGTGGEKEDEDTEEDVEGKGGFIIVSMSFFYLAILFYF